MDTRFLLSLMAVCLLVQPVVSDAQEMIISKGRIDLNINPRAAINGANGDVFVVWRGAVAENYANFSIYSALLAANGNGSFTARAVRRVEGNDHRAFRFDVAYDAANNRYLVVWNGADEGDTSGSLFGQFFHADGKPSGHRFKIVSDGQFEPLDPVILGLQTGVTAPSQGAAHFLLASSWNNHAVGDATGSGLRSILLDADGAPLGPAITVADSEVGSNDRPSVYINERLIPLSDGSILLATGHEIDPDQVVDEPMLFKLNPDGTKIASLKLDTNNSRFTSVVEISKKRLLSFWRNGQTYIYRLVNPKTLRAGKSIDGDAVEFAANSTLVKLSDDRGALHVVYRTHEIGLYYVDKKGRPVFPERDLIPSDREIHYEANAVALPDGNRVLLLYSLLDGAGGSELHGRVYEAELP